MDEILKWIIRIAGAYYFAGSLMSLGSLYEYRLYKGAKLEKEYTNINYNEQPKQTKIAVMVPAFKEENVIGRTLDFLVKAAESYDPKLVKVYVGVYPNDPDTRKVVNEFEKIIPLLLKRLLIQNPVQPLKLKT